MRVLLLFLSGIVLGSVLAGVASPASCQSIVVQVTAEESGDPIPGAFVTLLDHRGARLRSALTGPSGRFLFRVPGPGSYQVEGEMMGRETQVSASITVGEGESQHLHIPLPFHPISLAGIDVEADKRCRLRPEEASEVSRVWDEARKVLSIQAWTEDEGVYRMEILKYERDLDGNGRRVEKEEHRRTTTVLKSPFVSLPAEDLMSEGFIRPIEDGWHQYYGPDAQVLLSDLFLDTHCLRLTRSEDHPGLIGLGFEPLGESGLPDIEGTLWLDEVTSHLQFLEFGYTSSPYREARGVAGGRFDFQRTPEGAWIIGKWWVRTPLLARGRAMDRPGTSRTRLTGIRETGGEVLRSSAIGVAGLSGDRRGTLTGLVWDSTRSEPLEGAAVSLSGTPYSALTDGEGRFLIHEVMEGGFTANFHHSRLDSLGIDAPTVDVRVEPGEISDLVLGVPSYETLFHSRCTAEERGEGPGVVFGSVRDETSGEPIPGATVRADWQEVYRVSMVTGAALASDRFVEVRSASNGTYALCGIPKRELFQLRASIQDISGDVVEDRFTLEEQRHLDLVIGGYSEWIALGGLLTPQEVAPEPIQTEGTSPGEMSLVGMVVDAGTHLPVPSPTLVLRDAQGRVVATTMGDDGGNFRIRPSTPGVFQLEISRVGYASAEAEMALAEGQMQAVRVELELRPVELPGIDARVQPTPRHGGMTISGFRARQAAGIGTFFDESDIDERKPSRTTDLVTRAPGLNLLRLAGRPVDVSTWRSQGGFSKPGPCLTDLWIDGLKVREGGFPRQRLRDMSFLNDIVPPEGVAGIEIYTGVSQIPPQFNGPTAMCGVVVVWTKRDR